MNKSLIDVIKSDFGQYITNKCTEQISHPMRIKGWYHELDVMYILDNTIKKVSTSCASQEIFHHCCDIDNGFKVLCIYDKYAHYILHKKDNEFIYMLRCDNNGTTELIYKRPQNILSAYHSSCELPFRSNDIDMPPWKGCHYIEFMVDDIIVMVFFDIAWYTFNSIYEDIREHARKGILKTIESEYGEIEKRPPLLCAELDYILAKIKLLDQQTFTDMVVEKCKKESLISLNDITGPIKKYIDKWIEKNRNTVDKIIKSTRSIDDSVRFVGIKSYNEAGHSISNTNDKLLDTVRVTIGFDPSLEGTQIRDKFISLRSEIYKNVRIQMSMLGIKHKSLSLTNAVVQASGCMELIYTKER